MIDLLNSRPTYKVTELDDKETTETTVTNYTAINYASNEEDMIKAISQAEVVTTSVGVNILKFIAPVLAKGIDRRTNDAGPLLIMACEDSINASDQLAQLVKDPKNTKPDRLGDFHTRARFANATVDRIIPAQDPGSGLNVRIEKYFEWVVDANPFVDVGIPDLPIITWITTNLNLYVERKFLTYNTALVAAAYHGYKHSKRTIYDAMQDYAIVQEIKGTLNETKEVLLAKHETDERSLKIYTDRILKRMENRFIDQVVERAGRNPLRNLSRKGCLIDPVAQLAEMGKSRTFLLKAIEMGFRFQNVEGDDQSSQLADLIRQTSAEGVVAQVTGLGSSDAVYNDVVKVVQKVKG